MSGTNPINPGVPQSTSTTNYVEQRAPQINWTREDVTRYFNLFGNEAQSKMAEHTAMLIGENPQYSSYRGTDHLPILTELKTGQSPLLNFLPLQPEMRGKGLTNEQILKFYTNMEGSDEYDVDSYLKGLTRSSSGMVSGVAGARTAYSLAPPVAPVVGPFSKPLSALLGFLGGSIAGDTGGQLVAESLFDLGIPDDVVLTPSAEAELKAAESAGVLTPYIAMPWLLPKAQLQMTRFLGQMKSPRALLGTEQTGMLVRNPETGKFVVQGVTGPLPGLTRSTTSPVGPTADDLANPLIKNFLENSPLLAQYLDRGRVPLKYRLASGVEKALVSGRRRVQEAGTLGTTGILAAEAATVPAGYGLVLGAGEQFPRSEGMRITAEIAASLAPQLSLLKHLPKAASATTGFVREKTGRFRRGEPLDLFGAEKSAQMKAFRIIQDRVEKYGEDSEALLADLEKTFLTRAEDGSFKLKPEFRTMASEGQGIYASNFMDSPAIASLENAVIARVGDELGDARRASFEKSIELQKQLIYNFRESGNPELIAVAAEMQRDFYENLIGSRLGTAVDRVTQSFARLYPDGLTDEAALQMGTQIKAIVNQQQRAFRNIERRAWEKVKPDIPLSNFYDDAGEAQNLPNVILEWEALVNRMARYEPTTLKRMMADPDFQTLDQTIQSWRTRLGQGTGASSVTDMPKEVKAFQTQVEKLEGTNVLNQFNEVKRLKNITDEASSENIVALNRTIEAFTGRGKKSEVLKLLEAQRDALQAQRAQSGQAPSAALGPQDELLSGEFKDLRSTALAIQRKYTDGLNNAVPNDYFAKVAGGVANAALDDLSRAGLDDLTKAVTDARTLSRAYNDFYKRTFAFDVVRKDARGREFIDPGMVTSQLLTGAPDAVLMRVRQIQGLGNKLAEVSADAGQEAVETAARTNSTMNEVLSNTLRLAIQRIEVPLEERRGMNAVQLAEARLQKLYDFRAKHQSLFDAFPMLNEAVDNAKTADDFLVQAKTLQNHLNKKVLEDRVLKKAITSENPALSLAMALNNDNPITTLNGMLRRLRKPPMLKGEEILTRRGRRTRGAEPAYDVEEAEKALFSTIMNHAFLQGGKGGPQFNEMAVYTALFDKIPKAGDDQTLMGWAVKNNLVDSGTAEEIKEGLIKIIRLRSTTASQAAVDGEVPAIVDFYTRIAGARLGSFIAGRIPGGRGAGLVEAEAGSRYLRMLTQEIPAIAQLDALQEIMTNPELLALALKTPKSQVEKDSIMKRLISGLTDLTVGSTVPTGIKAPEILRDGEIGVEEELPEPAPEPTAAAPAPVPQNPMAARFGGGRPRPPVVQPAPQAAPQPVAQAPMPQGSPNPQQRAQMAALFPFDETMGATRGAGGIASLFG